MNNIDSIKVRMYRHGFGDCFLVRFFAGDSLAYKMLIDCGLKHNDSVDGVSIADIVDDIKEEIAVKKGRKNVPHLDVLAVTHEHWDHVSGFKPEKKLFDSFDIDNIWMAWTEDPNDEIAQQINAHLKENIAALTVAKEKLVKETNRKKTTGFYDSEYSGNQMLGISESFNGALGAILEFYGPLGATEVTPSGIKIKDNFRTSIETQKAFDHIKSKLAKNKAAIKYFTPGKIIDVKELPGIRIYVLGPPKNELINKDSPSRGANKEVYFSLSNASMSGFVKGLLKGADGIFDDGSPFQNVEYIDMEKAKKHKFYKDTYFSKENTWRTIEGDWLNMAGSLALQMDSDTNNTSLVLAFEIIETGKILLFPGDAQVGNWLSWHDYIWQVKDGECGKTRDVTATDILNRTVFYKAGHHASHNATLKEKGLELMEDEDLVVFIPEKQDQYNGIPYSELIDRMMEKAKGRVLFSADKNFPPEDALKNKPDSITKKDWDKFKKNIAVTEKYIEYTIN